jgi:UDP-N-acetylglucosamine:LPS N-acetylglucosamine transferase
MKQKIMFFYLKTGGGHLACARSVSEYMAKHHSRDTEIIMVDGLQESPRIKKFIFEDTYRLTQNYAEWLYEFTYNVNRLPRMWRQTRRLVDLLLEEYLEKRILEDRPDKIVVFHCFFVKIVEDILARLGLDIPVIVFVTDPYEPPNLWFTSKKHQYIVSNGSGIKAAVRMGVPKSRCVTFDYTVNERYSRKMTDEEIRKTKKKLGYPPGRKIVLIVGGADGIPKGFSMLTSLLRKKLDAEIAIVCGKNEPLREVAAQLAKRYKNLHVYGFIDYVYELLNICDVAITKCGASMVTEILIQEKIMIINSHLGGQEIGNLNFVVNNRLGFCETRVTKLAPLIRRIFENPEITAKIKANLRKLRLKNGTPDVAEYICSYRQK